ncbi:hypothetical protein QFC22_005017 [Naganishia vaughanmartiniae]|uniref:Uncharacterized protein n=1 Tax=Naganishia vaughanmartiniae TaxID=1424756 RepID=A0ACC2WXJ7_9TREE|nr:hypothetical protein QFC22_005017 [Naganishia vaughanmartiniae]
MITYLYRQLYASDLKCARIKSGNGRAVGPIGCVPASQRRVVEFKTIRCYLLITHTRPSNTQMLTSTASRLHRTTSIVTARSFSTSRRATMPIYVCHCPDYPNSLDKRLSVRDAHLKDAGKDKEDGLSRELDSSRYCEPCADGHLALSLSALESFGNVSDCIVFGRAFLSPEYSTSSVNPAPAIPAGQPNPGMAGSVMLLKFPTIEACWDRLKRDKYWEAGVWDKEKTTVVELIAAPGDEDKRDL